MLFCSKTVPFLYFGTVFRPQAAAEARSGARLDKEGCMEYNVTKIRDGVWAIDENTVRMFLVDGGTEALLIDTGFGSGDLKELVSSLVSGEITVINTHCHGELDVEPVYLDKMIRCCEGILDRTIRPGTALNSAGAVERAFWFEDVAVFH